MPLVLKGTTVLFRKQAIAASALLALLENQQIQLPQEVMIVCAPFVPKVPTRLTDWPPQAVRLVKQASVLRAPEPKEQTHRLVQCALLDTQALQVAVQLDAQCVQHPLPTQLLETE